VLGVIDFQTRLRLLSEATAKRDEFARRALELLKQGKEKAGMAAARKAEYWDAKAKAVER
jgi:hypothetical protein